MKIFRHSLIPFSLAFFSHTQAKQKITTHEKKTHEHKAHVHGSATLSIAMENSKSGSILLESPGESIIGFEHEAKSPSDIKSRDKSLAILKNQGSELFVFPIEKKCVINSTKVEIKKENSKNNHSEIEAHFSFSCEKDLSKSSLQVNLGKKFPRIEDLDVQLISDKKQSASELEKGLGSITF
jgi:hypothetical protein